MTDPKFCIISAGWKSGPWVRGCVESILEQTYTNYDVCFVDDDSQDPELTEYLTNVCSEHGWKLILRTNRTGGPKNQMDGIRLMNPSPEDVVVWLDSDDRFAHPYVLRKLVDYYADGTRMTYGSYQPDPPSATCAPAQPYPADVIESRTYREMALAGRGILWNHLRTAKAELVLAITDDDIRGPDGNFLLCATDSALMFPMLELAGPNVKFIPETLLIYNSENPHSDWRRQPREVDQGHEWVLTRPKKDPTALLQHPLDADQRREFILRNQRGRQVLIETGTADGTNAAALAASFGQVFTIEVAEDNYLNAITQLSGIPNITPLFGSSAVVLPLLIDSLQATGVVFWLDAHDNGHTPNFQPNPLLDEIAHILYRRPANSTILVDDVHLCGKAADFPTLERLHSFVEEHGGTGVVESGIMRIEIP